MVWKSIFKNILIFDGRDFGNNPVHIMGCIKFYWKDSHLHCVYLSFRLLYSTVHIILQNLLSRVCMTPEMWKWLAVGRWHCGAAVRVMRIKKPFVRLGAFHCWLGCWRLLMKTCWFRWWGLCKNVHQRLHDNCYRNYISILTVYILVLYFYLVLSPRFKKVLRSNRPYCVWFSYPSDTHW